ncbi:MAG: SGNH/GDSL hydrolase family protein [Acidimicrobiia bacterium]|nr:SGNH/GDSL hydrolase family protein [Acidimicrobiia bacterium]
MHDVRLPAIRLPKRLPTRLPKASPRAVALGVPAAAVGAMAAVGVQAWYVANRNLPEFEELDPSGTFGDPQLPPVRITMLGDSSITAPGLDDPDDIWIRQIARRLATSYRVEIVNHAKSGARARDVFENQVGPATAERGDVAVVSVGANDAVRGTSMSLVELLIEEIVTELRLHHAAVVLCGVGDLGDCPRLPFPLAAIAGERCRAANSVHERVAERVDGVVRAPLREECTERFRDPGLYSPDLFHPNAEGHAVWADAAFPVIADAVRTTVRDRSAAR